MANDSRDPRRSHFSIRVAMALMILLALNFWAARPGPEVLHGAGHWLGAIFLQVSVLQALRRGHVTRGLIGFEVAGWGYLAYRWSTGPAAFWWEDRLAKWMAWVEVRMRGTSWNIDRWYVHEIHLQAIQLVELLAWSTAGLYLSTWSCSVIRRLRRRSEGVKDPR